MLRFRGDDDRGGHLGRGPARGPARAPDGDYAFTVRVRDRAGNAAVAPADVPSAAQRAARAPV